MKKGLQSLEFSFEADSLTHYGGLFLIQRFCHKLDFRRRLQRLWRAAPDWSEFDPVDLVLLLLFLLTLSSVKRDEMKRQKRGGMAQKGEVVLLL